jgi:hypothetical protein
VFRFVPENPTNLTRSCSTSTRVYPAKSEPRQIRHTSPKWSVSVLVALPPERVRMPNCLFRYVLCISLPLKNSMPCGLDVSIVLLPAVACSRYCHGGAEAAKKSCNDDVGSIFSLAVGTDVRSKAKPSMRLYEDRDVGKASSASSRVYTIDLSSLSKCRLLLQWQPARGTVTSMFEEEKSRQRWCIT